MGVAPASKRSKRVAARDSESQSQPDVVGPPSARAAAEQGGPTLEETVAWLKSKLDGYALTYRTSDPGGYKVSKNAFCGYRNGQKIPCSEEPGEDLPTVSVIDVKFAFTRGPQPPSDCNLHFAATTTTTLRSAPPSLREPGDTTPVVKMNDVMVGPMLTKEGAISPIAGTPWRYEEAFPKAGMPQVTLTPDIFCLSVVDPDDLPTTSCDIPFISHELAVRVSTAMAHLGQLCGGTTGAKAEPF